jgi:hypothetical protein
VSVRFFIAQEALDGLLEKEAATMAGDVLTIPERKLTAGVQAAVYFLREVEGKADPHGLVGKVQTLEAIVAKGADHFRASVILGETAYDVVEGYLGEAPEGWAWPGGNGAAEPEAVAPEAIASAPTPAAVSRLPKTVAPPPPPTEDEGDDIPVDFDEPSAPTESDRPVHSPSKRPSLAPAARARLESKPGYHAPAPPPAIEEVQRVRPPRRPSRPPPGVSRLPAPSPASGVRASRPPPPPPPSGRRSLIPPAAPDAERSSSSQAEPASPARTADELEKILLEAIRPSRRKRT